MALISDHDRFAIQFADRGVVRGSEGLWRRAGALTGQADEIMRESVAQVAVVCMVHEAELRAMLLTLVVPYQTSIGDPRNVFIKIVQSVSGEDARTAFVAAREQVISFLESMLPRMAVDRQSDLRKRIKSFSTLTFDSEEVSKATVSGPGISAQTVRSEVTRPVFAPVAAVVAILITVSGIAWSTSQLRGLREQLRESAQPQLRQQLLDQQQQQQRLRDQVLAQQTDIVSLKSCIQQEIGDVPKDLAAPGESRGTAWPTLRSATPTSNLTQLTQRVTELQKFVNGLSEHGNRLEARVAQTDELNRRLIALATELSHRLGSLKECGESSVAAQK